MEATDECNLNQKPKFTLVLIVTGTQYKANFKTMYQLIPLQDKGTQV